LHRPTVLHILHTWGIPSEGFVRDLVATTTATQSVIATMTVTGPPAEVRTVSIGRDWHRRVLPHPLRPHSIAIGAAVVATVHRAALVHSHFGHMIGTAAAVARWRRTPWIASLHGHDLLVEAPMAPWAPALAQADLIAVPSRFLAQHAEARGLDSDRIRVLPSGVDLARHPFMERRPEPDGAVNITFVGRFVEKKGALDALVAIAAVSQSRPWVRARFVGYGPQMAELVEHARRARVAIEVVDGREPGAVDEALARTQLVIAPSRTAASGDAETLCLVALEAQARGIPVLTTDHGGLPEAVGPGAGVLVPEGDQHALGSALASLVDDSYRWPAMGRAGRAFVANRYELGACVAAIQEAQLALIDGRPASTDHPWAPTQPLRVSVVIPAFNRAPLLDRTLDALESQTYPSALTEVIVIDNGSTDDTAARLSARRPQWALHVLHNRENQTAAGARNQGVAVATGDVIAFTDSDCRPTPTWLEALLAGFEDDIDIVQGRTAPDPTQPYEPLSRSQSVPCEYGLYETCNIGYRRAVLASIDGPFSRDMPNAMDRLVGTHIGEQAFGEDVDLAWSAKRAGARSRFAATAIVHHHVFPPDVTYLFRRSALVAGFPLLLRRHPPLRRAFLWKGLFVGPHRLDTWLLLAGVSVAGRWPRQSVLLALPWAWHRVQPHRPGARARVHALPILLSRDVVESAALVYGSLRTHRVVL